MFSISTAYKSLYISTQHFRLFSYINLLNLSDKQHHELFLYTNPLDLFVKQHHDLFLYLIVKQSFLNQYIIERLIFHYSATKTLIHCHNHSSTYKLEQGQEKTIKPEEKIY